MIGDRKWSDTAFHSLDNLTKNFLDQMNPGLSTEIISICSANKWDVRFLPVAPYGQKPQPNPGKNPPRDRVGLEHKEKLVMVPFLNILHKDGIITQ